MFQTFNKEANEQKICLKFSRNTLKWVKSISRKIQEKQLISDYSEKKNPWVFEQTKN